MSPATEARIGVWGLLGLQLAAVLAGVLLLGRMSPAIDEILADNVYSLEATEAMLAELADTEDRARFDEALARARSNVTEEAEVPILDRLEGAVAEGLPPAGQRSDLVEDLTALSEVNRGSMQRAGDEAERLGLAGAWSLAGLGIVAFWLSVVATRRLQRRVIAPVEELADVLAAVRQGDEQRRCGDVAGTDPRIVRDLNWLLDRRFQPAEASTREDDGSRRALLGLLDAIDDAPAFLVRDDGAVLATNRAALQQQVDVATIARAVDAEGAAEGWAVRGLDGGVRWVRRLDEATPAP